MGGERADGPRPNSWPRVGGGASGRVHLVGGWWPAERCRQASSRSKGASPPAGMETYKAPTMEEAR